MRGGWRSDEQWEDDEDGDHTTARNIVSTKTTLQKVLLVPSWHVGWSLLLVLNLSSFWPLLLVLCRRFGWHPLQGLRCSRHLHRCYILQPGSPEGLGSLAVHLRLLTLPSGHLPGGTMTVHACYPMYDFCFCLSLRFQCQSLRLLQGSSLSSPVVIPLACCLFMPFVY